MSKQKRVKNGAKCPSCASKNTYRNGRHKNSGQQNNKCRVCGRQFVTPKLTPLVVVLEPEKPKPTRSPVTNSKAGRPVIGENPLSPCHGVASVKKGHYESKREGRRDRYMCTAFCCGKTFLWPPSPPRPTPNIDQNPSAPAKPFDFRGEHNPHAKLSEAEVLEILALKERGLSGVEISEQILKPYSTIMGVLSGRTWSWLTGIPNPSPTR